MKIDKGKKEERRHNLGRDEERGKRKNDSKWRVIGKAGRDGEGKTWQTEINRQTNRQTDAHSDTQRHRQDETETNTDKLTKRQKENK